MRMSYPITLLLTITFLLGGCSTTKQPSPKVASNFITKQSQLASNFIYKQNVTVTTKSNYPAKNPKSITVFANNEAPHAAYRVIGVATVSKYNFIGVQRKDATLHEMMKNLAASIGGDGLMNIENHGESVQAKVIQFQKILI